MYTMIPKIKNLTNDTQKRVTEGQKMKNLSKEQGLETKTRQFEVFDPYEHWGATILCFR